MKEFQEMPKDDAGRTISNGEKVVWADSHGEIHRGWVEDVPDDWEHMWNSIYVKNTRGMGQRRAPRAILVMDW